MARPIRAWNVLDWNGAMGRKKNGNLPMDVAPLNILLAEDERAVAFSIVFALKLDGHNVQIVADGRQAPPVLMSNPIASGI